MSFQLSVNGTFSAARAGWAEKASKTAASATAVALPGLKLSRLHDAISFACD